jgi:hypothetical protein
MALDIVEFSVLYSFAHNFQAGFYLRPNSSSLTVGLLSTLTLGCRTGPPAICSSTGRYDNPKPESTISLQSGTKNFATVVSKNS